jgi:hypothetical protein
MRRRLHRDLVADGTRPPGGVTARGGGILTVVLLAVWTLAGLRALVAWRSPANREAVQAG